MKRKNWIGAIFLGILGFFGIGTGIKRHNQRKQDELDRQRRENKKRDRLLESIDMNQMELTKNQLETLKMIKKLQEEMGIDPNQIDTDLEKK